MQLYLIIAEGKVPVTLTYCHSVDYSLANHPLMYRIKSEL